MLATEPRLAIVWDEGYTLGREARLRQWFSALRDPAGFAARWKPPLLELVQQDGAPPPRRRSDRHPSEAALRPRVLAYFWPFAREEPHGHPPFYALLGLAGDVLAPAGKTCPAPGSGRSCSSASRPACCFISWRAGGASSAAIGAAAAWVFQPNLFGHGHYATYDAVLSSPLGAGDPCLRGGGDDPRDPAGRSATSAADRSRRLRAGGRLCALATKLTGWFLPLPFLAWAVLGPRVAGPSSCWRSA